MRCDAQPVSLTTDIYEVQQRLDSEQLDALPVVENGRCLGIITRRNIQKSYSWSKSESERKKHNSPLVLSQVSFDGYKIGSISEIEPI